MLTNEERTRKGKVPCNSTIIEIQVEKLTKDKVEIQTIIDIDVLLKKLSSEKKHIKSI